MDPTSSHVPQSEARNEQALGANDDQVLRDRITSLEEEVLNLQVNLTAYEARAKLAIDSENFMLGEVQKASEQLLCKHPNFKLLAWSKHIIADL